MTKDACFSEKTRGLNLNSSEFWPLISGRMLLIMIYNLHFSNNNACVNYLLVYVHKFIIVLFIFLFYMYNLTLFSEICMKTLFTKTINASQLWPCHQLTKSAHETLVIIFWIALYLLGIIH